ERRRQRGATRRARRAGGAIEGTVVALLGAVDDAVAARLDLTGRRATVAGLPVAVVARLADADDAVTAHGGVREAVDLDGVGPERVPGGVSRADVERPPLLTRAVRDAQQDGPRAVVDLRIGGAGVEHAGARLDRHPERTQGRHERAGIALVGGVARREGSGNAYLDVVDRRRAAPRQLRIRHQQTQARPDGAGTVAGAVHVAAGVTVRARLDA